MFWKVACGLAILGIVLGLIIFIVSLPTLTTSTDEFAQDIALGFFLFSILLFLGSILLLIVSGIMLLRASKKEFDAKNPPKDK